MQWTCNAGSVAGALVLIATVGCSGGQDRGEWTPVDADALSTTQRAQHDRALAAQGDLMAALGGRLMEVVTESGPAAALTVCSDEASELTNTIAERHGVRIGRTSARLRNPINTPPDWARDVVAGTSDEAAVLAGPRGEIGLLGPLRTKALCTGCHGPAEGLAPEIRTALADLYPEDEAIGFSDGDLRGWVWVEVDR